MNFKWLLISRRACSSSPSVVGFRARGKPHSRKASLSNYHKFKSINTCFSGAASDKNSAVDSSRLKLILNFYELHVQKVIKRTAAEKIVFHFHRKRKMAFYGNLARAFLHFFLLAARQCS